MDDDGAIAVTKKVSVVTSNNETFGLNLSAPKIISVQAIEESLNTRKNYDIITARNMNSIKTNGGEDKYSVKDMSSISEQMESVYFSHPGLIDVFSHVNLMKGNTISDTDLIDAVSNKYSKYHEDIIARLELKYGDADTFETLIRYEKTVLGELVEHNKIKDLTHTRSFQDYKDYLIRDEIFIPFCKKNASSLICEK
jgi:hypothetical protein